MSEGCFSETIRAKIQGESILLTHFGIVLDTPAMKKRAEEIGVAIKKENGVQRAVELIEVKLLPKCK